MQSADERPEPNFQRKAAIAAGGVIDHAGAVQVTPIPDFDLNRTIFQTLEGGIARSIMQARVGKEVLWQPEAAQQVQEAYEEGVPSAPPVAKGLLTFLVEECDFDVEHADGSFLDHLYFCYEYSVAHYPDHPARVMLLHSILGTGTNTFAMTADKIDALREHLTEEEWTHIEAFPSVLRLLYDLPLRRELWANLDRLDELQSIRFRRVIDNAPIEMSAEDFWVQLNFQLMHLIDFLPVANWRVHQNETTFLAFRDLFDLLERTGKRGFALDYTPPSGPRTLKGETQTRVGWLASLLPNSVVERLSAKSVRRFSERIGHSMEYELRWR
ncbi:MAG: hypothetical protein KTR31_18850 [Myxococcales bacterium]|nr:hypothetical protein [Myxococcales bacterium]